MTCRVEILWVNTRGVFNMCEGLYPSLRRKSNISFNLVGVTLNVVGYFELIYRIVFSGTFNLLARYCAVESLLRTTLFSCFISIVL